MLVHEDCVLCGPVTLPTSYNLHSHGLTRRGWGRGHNSTHKGAWQLPALCCLLPASCSRRDRPPRCGPPGPHLLPGSFRPRAHHPEPRGPREDEAAQVSGGGGRCRPGWGLMESRGPPLGQVGTKAPARRAEPGSPNGTSGGASGSPEPAHPAGGGRVGAGTGAEGGQPRGAPGGPGQAGSCPSWGHLCRHPVSAEAGGPGEVLIGCSCGGGR